MIDSKMWKPGTEKPNGMAPSSSSKKKKKNKSRPKLDDLAMGAEEDHSRPHTPASSATPRKRLSGGTMNMRFMKRRKDANATSNKKNSETENHQQLSNREATTSSHSRMDVDNDAMDVSDDHDNNSAQTDSAMDGSKFAKASSVDMYGIEASLIGRRSFRGFNEPIERIWKDSKATLEKREINSRREKISDEELLRRYHDSANQKGTDERGIGNLDKKRKKRSSDRLKSYSKIILHHHFGI